MQLMTRSLLLEVYFVELSNFRARETGVRMNLEHRVLLFRKVTTTSLFQFEYKGKGPFAYYLQTLCTMVFFLLIKIFIKEK